jgi:hypothetical protein
VSKIIDSDASDVRNRSPVRDIADWDETTVKVYPPTQWIVENFLPIGLTILAGKSKVGKSWFILNLCKAVASGKVSFCGKMSEPQEVLYLALDDPPFRLQLRGKELGFDNVGLGKKFKSATWWNRFQDPSKKDSKIPDGHQDLKLALEKHDKVRLVVIDVWQKVRPMKRAYSDDYEKDYAHLSEIKQLAYDNDCAIILSHHMKKGFEYEKNDGVIGSVAVQGCCDNIWVLERDKSNKTGTLTPSGKDSFDEDVINFKCEEGIWEYVGEKKVVELTDNEKCILGKMKGVKSPLTFSQIVTLSAIPKGSVSKSLSKLRGANLVVYDTRNRIYLIKNL